MAAYLVRLLLLVLKDGIGGGVLLGRAFDIENDDDEAGLGGRLADACPNREFFRSEGVESCSRESSCAAARAILSGGNGGNGGGGF